MAHITMTVQEGLNQLKILRDRIAAATNQPFVSTANAKGMVTSLGVSAEQFGHRAQSSLQSATDLINNYRAIKRAINQSNARVEIVIDDRAITVAEAIDWKKSIDFVIALRNKLTMDLTAAQRTVGQNHERVQRDAEASAQTLFNQRDNANAKDYDAFIELFLARNAMRLVDDVRAQDVIDALTTHIDNFRAQVDLALTVSNVTNSITVDLA